MRRSSRLRQLGDTLALPGGIALRTHMQDLNDLYIFSQVVEHNGFTGAARAMGLSRSSVCRRVSHLESKLGIRLVQRTTRHFSVTEVGKEFHSYCAKMVAAAREAHDHAECVRGTPSGVIRVSCPPGLAQLLIVPLIPHFLEQNPKVRLAVDSSDRRADVVESFDLAIRVRQIPTEDSGLVMRSLGIVQQVLVASPAFLARNGRPATPGEAARLSTLGCGAPSGPHVWTFVDAQDCEIQVRHEPTVISEDILMIRQAAVAGVGIAKLPLSVCLDEVRQGQLEVILEEHFAPLCEIQVVFPSRRGMRPAVRSFIDFLSEHCVSEVAERQIKRHSGRGPRESVRFWTSREPPKRLIARDTWLAGCAMARQLQVGMDSGELAMDSGAPVGEGQEVSCGPIEQRLAAIWAKVLKVGAVGPDDNFFELGGQSLAGMAILDEIARQLHVHVPLVGLFQCPTVREMAGVVETLRADDAESAQTGADEAAAAVGAAPQRWPSDGAPLTFSQQWSWQVLDLAHRCGSRSIAVALRLSGELNVSALSQSFAALIRRHEALRTRIVIVDDAPAQCVDETGPDVPAVFDLTKLPENERETEARRLVEELVHEPVDLAAGPLFGARVLRLANHEHVLSVAMDHMISDGASVGILFRDLWASYAQTLRGAPGAVPPPPARFADYALWLRSTHESWMQEHGNYWRQRLAGARSARLPEVARDPSARVRLAALPVRLGESLTAELREWSRRAHTTLVMSVLTAYIASLARWCNEPDLVVTFLSMARPPAAASDTIGYFGAPLFLRVEVAESEEVVELATRVTREYGAACDHADAGRIAVQTPMPEFVSNPRFNWIPTEFNMSPAGQVGMLEGLGLEQRPFPFTPRDDFDERGGGIELMVSDTRHGIAGNLWYRSDLHSSATIEQFAQDFLNFVQRMVETPEARVVARSAARSASSDVGQPLAIGNRRRHSEMLPLNEPAAPR